MMALGAMACYPDVQVKIVPVGLSYFHAHRFRSRGCRVRTSFKCFI